MHAIIRQAKANLKSHKLQAVLILVTLFAAATLLTVALSTFHSTQGAYDRLFKRTHGAHLWLYLDPERVTAEKAEALLTDLPGVEATTGAMRYIRATLFMGEERVSGLHLRAWPDETATVARPLLVAGRAPLMGEIDAIVLDRNVAAAHDIDVGDSVSLLLPAGQRPLTVVGQFVSAEFCPYPSCFPPRNYLAPGALTALGLTPSASPGMRDSEGLAIGLRLQNAAEIGAVRQTVEEALPDESIATWHDWKDIGSWSGFALQFERVIFISFSIVAALAAGFLIANTIGGTVRAQTRQIGLLKAVGFTRRQLVFLNLAEYLGLALLASLAGLAVASPLALSILRPVAAAFGETEVNPPLWIVIAVPLSTLLIATVFTLWPVRRAVRLDAVEAIRFGAERARHRAAKLPRVSLPLAVGVSDVFSRPRRSVLTALGLALAVLALTATLTLNATLNAFTSDPTLYGFDADLLLYPSAFLTDEDVRRIIAAQSEVQVYHSQIWWNFQFPGEDETLSARFPEGDLEAFRYPLVEGRMFENPDEVVVGYGLARERNLHPGDTLTVLLEGEPLALRVVGTYREISNMGRMLLAPAETLRRLRPDASAFSYRVKLRSSADAEAVATALRRNSNDLLEVTLASEERAPSNITALPKVMAALAIVLGSIAMLGVFNNVWMGVQERQRELALFKAVGMTPRQVTQSVLTGAGMLALFAYVVGMPLGLAGIRALMDAMARGIGFGPLDPPVDRLGLLLILPGIVLVALAGAYLPARRAGRTSVVETLRYE